MRIEFYRTLWGLEEKLAEYLPKLKERGYHGIETSLLFHSKEQLELIQNLSQFDLKLILLILTSGKTVNDHLESFKEQLEKSVKLSPVKINVHGGMDCWSWEETRAYFEGVEKLISTCSIPILHETHRGRIMFTPWTTLQVIKTFPNIHLTADLSHWVVVTERHLEEFDLDTVFTRVDHIHARPCSPQSIQLLDLDEEYYKPDLDAFKSYWLQILRTRRDQGMKVMTVDPEFGPAPYSTIVNGKPFKSLEVLADGILAIFKQLEREL